MMARQTAEYNRTHDLVRLVRGDAWLYPCVDCNSRGAEWSYVNGTCRNDISNYEPRCNSCHLKYDYTDERRLKLSKSLEKPLSKSPRWTNKSSKSGSGNGRAKLAESDVLEIRAMYATGNWTKRQIANLYGVTDVAISKIIHRQTWSHL